MSIVTLVPGSELANLVKPFSRKRKAILAIPSDRVHLTGTYLQAGGRRDYYLVDLTTMHAQPLGHYNPVQFGGPREDLVVNLKPHQAVVQVGTFCGKPSTPTVYFHPEHKM